MGFHKRYIDNEQVIRLYRDGGIKNVEDWYTRGADAGLKDRCTIHILSESFCLSFKIICVHRRSWC